MASTFSSSRPQSRPALAIDAAIALAATFAFVSFHALRGFPSLADSGGDNDSLLRLVQVRDLLAGQGWFDPTQYRMGLDGGFAMHWSRLVDLPIAVLVTALGETAALVIWPSLLFAACLFLIVRTARLLGGDSTVLPAMVTGALALHFVNVFLPGALDHHNAQLALVFVAVHALARAVRVDAASPARDGAVAGTGAALMLAIGMEAAPYAAAACLLATFCFLRSGDAERRIARGFGVAFAATGAAAFVATLPAREWFAVHCDALSFPQGSLAVLGGGGLALIASIPALSGSLRARLAALAGLGLAAAVLALATFPQCLGDPFIDLDPKLRLYWLNAVSEAQSFMDLARAGDLGTLAGYYVTPIIALAVVALRAARGNSSRAARVVAAFLAVAFVVSLWQVRGGVFSVPLAAVVLATWIGSARSHAQTDRGVRAQLVMAGAWLTSFSLVWQFAVLSINAFVFDGGAMETKEAGERGCYALSDYDSLSALPPGTVLTISNLGSSVLRQTPHRVLNGPYHRNNEGNRAALDILMGEPERAQEAVRALGIDYVVLCRGNPETKALVKWSQGGFLAKLKEDSSPSWLMPLAGAENAPLEIFELGER